MIVITTPTGDIGSQVVDLLLHDSPQHPTRTRDDIRVIARDPSTLPQHVRDSVDVVAGSHADPDVVDRAFDGADAVFWLVPPARDARNLDEAYSGFTHAAARAFVTHEVGHVVGVSALGRGSGLEESAGLVTATLAMDDLIATTGVAYRALANGSFMDNLLRQVASIRDDAVFRDTQDGRRRAPAVATRDIASTAAALLVDRSWTGVDSVPLLGPDDISQEDMAEIVSDVLGKPVRFERQSLEQLAAMLSGYGAGEAFVGGMVDMMRAKDDGLDSTVVRHANDLARTTFRQWCEDVLRPAVLAPRPGLQERTSSATG